MVRRRHLAQRRALTAFAHADCAADRDDELSFKRGDILKILDDTEPDWYRAQLKEKVGMVPASYVRLMS